MFEDCLVLLEPLNPKSFQITLTSYDFDLTLLKRIGQFIGDLAIQFAYEKGYTDDLDVPALIIEQCTTSTIDRIGYFLDYVQQHFSFKKSYSDKDKLTRALLNVKSTAQIAVILTEKSITLQFIPKLVQWIANNELVCILPFSVYQLCLKNVVNPQQSDAYGVCYTMIIQELKKENSTLVLQTTLKDKSIENCFYSFKELQDTEQLNQFKSLKLFVLGSMKDYSKLPTIDIFDLEQLVQ